MAGNGNDKGERDNHSSQPYVRYSILSDIYDKGVGFAVKRAIDSFMKNHGYEYRVHLQEKVSDRFEAVLEMYSGGNPDLLINALTEHIAKSGRLPHKQDHKPSVVITPIPCEGNISIVTESRENIAYDKMVGTYEKKLIERDETIKGLTSSLSSVQRVISERDSRIKDLEKRIEDSSGIRSDDPFELVIRSYIPRGLEDLFNASADFDSVSISDRNIFVSNSDERLDYLSYIEKKCGIKFKSEEEFEEGSKRMEEHLKWDSTDKAVELTRATNSILTDRKVYEDAKKQNASPELLSALENVIGDSEIRANQAREEYSRGKAEFESERKAYEMLGPNSEDDYSALMNAIKNSDERRRNKAEFPVIVVPKAGEAGRSLNFYVSSIDSGSILEGSIYDTILSSISAPRHYETASSQYGDDTRQISAVMRTDDKTERISVNYTKIIENPVLAALGLTPRLITMQELK